MAGEQQDSVDFTANSLAMLAAEDFLRSFAAGETARSLDVFLANQVDRGVAMSFALALIAEQAARDAAKHQDMPFDEYLRGVTSWLLHHYEKGGES